MEILSKLNILDQRQIQRNSVPVEGNSGTLQFGYF